jgi:hypothetical protein
MGKKIKATMCSAKFVQFMASKIIKNKIMYSWKARYKEAH